MALKAAMTTDSICKETTCRAVAVYFVSGHPPRRARNGRRERRDVERDGQCCCCCVLVHWVASLRRFFAPSQFYRLSRWVFEANRPGGGNCQKYNRFPCIFMPPPSRDGPSAMPSRRPRLEAYGGQAEDAFRVKDRRLDSHSIIARCSQPPSWSSWSADIDQSCGSRPRWPAHRRDVTQPQIGIEGDRLP
jgi:hypothetical protein